LANGGLVPTGHQWLITRFGKLAATVSASDLGQTLSGGKFRNGASRFKGTQTGGVRVQNSTLIFPNEEKAASTGQSVAVIFPNGPGGETTQPRAFTSKDHRRACRKRLSWRWWVDTPQPIRFAQQVNTNSELRRGSAFRQAAAIGLPGSYQKP
jgi:hypothetical protein